MAPEINLTTWENNRKVFFVVTLQVPPLAQSPLRLLDALAHVKIPLVCEGRSVLLYANRPPSPQEPSVLLLLPGSAMGTGPRKTPAVVREALEQQGPD